MIQRIDGVAADMLDLFLVGDRHLIISDEGTHKVSRVEHGNGTMKVEVLEDGEYEYMADAVQAIRKDRKALGLPRLQNDDGDQG